MGGKEFSYLRRRYNIDIPDNTAPNNANSISTLQPTQSSVGISLKLPSRVVYKRLYVDPPTSVFVRNLLRGGLGRVCVCECGEVVGIMGVHPETLYFLSPRQPSFSYAA